MNYPKIIKVEPRDKMFLFVEFNNGDKKLLDVKPYVKLFKPFKELLDKKIFKQVRLDKLGRGLIWSKDIDLDGYDAWKYGKTIENE